MSHDIDDQAGNGLHCEKSGLKFPPPERGRVREGVDGGATH
jgi:hypothetical protein